jgi:hypothetical protein
MTEVSDHVNSFLKHRAIPGLKIETRGTQNLYRNKGSEARRLSCR